MCFSRQNAAPPNTDPSSYRCNGHKLQRPQRTDSEPVSNYQQKRPIGAIALGRSLQTQRYMSERVSRLIAIFAGSQLFILVNPKTKTIFIIDKLKTILE